MACVCLRKGSPEQGNVKVDFDYAVFLSFCNTLSIILLDAGILIGSKSREQFLDLSEFKKWQRVIVT